MTLAKAHVQMEEDHLDSLRQLVSAGRASARELQEQELKVQKAKARLAELGNIPATQPGRDVFYQGRVVDLAGKPVLGASVVLVANESWITVRNGRPKENHRNVTLTTDAGGNVAFPMPADPFMVVVLHDDGFAVRTHQQLTAAKTISIEPWGQVAGSFEITGEPRANRLIDVSIDNPYNRSKPPVYFEHQVRTNEQGQFSFPRVRLGKGIVGERIELPGGAWPFTHTVPVEVKAGHTTSVTIGGNGAAVTGQVVLPDHDRQTNWKFGYGGLSLKEDARRYYSFPIDKDGIFRVADVMPGLYTLRIGLHTPPREEHENYGPKIGQTRREITIKEPFGEGVSKTFDIGIVQLKFLEQYSATQPAKTDKADEADRAVRKRLRQVIPKMQFDGIQLKDVLDFLRNVSNCPIHVKWAELEKAGITKNSKVNVRLTNVTLDKAVRTILDDVAGPGKLGFVVEEGVITISTQADLDRATATRVYDIRDLIRPIRDFESEGLGWPKRKPEVKDKEPDPTESEMAEEVMDLIKATVAPDSWPPKGETASMRLLGGQLIITQAPRHHKDILMLLGRLREGRSLQILVEAKFIQAPSGADKRLTEWLAKNTDAAFQEGRLDRFLSDKDAEGFVKEALNSKGVMLTAPRITLYNGQRAFVFVGEQEKIKLPLLDNKDMSFGIPFRTGASLDVEATVFANRRHVALMCTPETAEISQQAGKFETSRAKATATISIPDEKTIVMRMLILKYQPTGVRQLRDPDTGKTSSEVVEKPIPGQPQRYVYVLIKPRIIIQREHEEINPPTLNPDLRHKPGKPKAPPPSQANPSCSFGWPG